MKDNYLFIILLVIIAIFLLILFFNNNNNNNNNNKEQDVIDINQIEIPMSMKDVKLQRFLNLPNNSLLPKPAKPPSSGPTWSQRGFWAIPFSVRYAISYSDGETEGPMSDWSEYFSSSQFSNPILSKFPVTLNLRGMPKVKFIKIYRQFEGHPPILLDVLPYPYLGRYTDSSGDDY